MKRLLICAGLIFCCCCKTFSQEKKEAPKTVTCSDKLKLISYWWKLDSLANNGFRIFNYDILLECDFIGITSDSLISILGKPTRTWNTNKGLLYDYMCFDGKKMPKELFTLFDNVFIRFGFDKDGKVKSIVDGHVDY